MDRFFEKKISTHTKFYRCPFLGADLSHADGANGRTNGHVEANNRFRTFAKSPNREHVCNCDSSVLITGRPASRNVRVYLPD